IKYMVPTYESVVQN
ncbi:MAG: hypothetical protein EZS28_049437, partial [Streblomastix strix]